MLNLYDVEKTSTIYGPGNRFVIWVQGCTLGCIGCWNNQMWSIEEKKLVSVEDLFQQIKTTENIEGITLLGGEPMHQAEQLLELCKKVRSIGLSVFLYTGYEIEELQKVEEKKLLDLADIIVCGRYDYKLRNTFLQWRGSSNQRVIFHTERYANFILDDANYCEVEINEDGVITISGYPDQKLLRSFREDEID